MRYVHEFVDDLVCERCPHCVEDEEGEFDLICLAQEDGSEFLFPDECPAYLGEWGAWRAGLAETMEAARHDGALGNLRRIVAAINAVCAAGWSL